MAQLEREALTYLPQNLRFWWKFASGKSILGKIDIDYAPSRPREKLQKNYNVF